MTAMHILNLLIVGGCSLGFVWLGWRQTCVEKTYQQRMSLIPTFPDPLFFVKLQAFDSVGWDDHRRALMTFRDPMRLYPAILKGDVE